MHQFRELTPQEMKMAEASFEARRKVKRTKNNNKKFQFNKETRGRNPETEKSKRVGTLSRGERQKIKDQELLSIYDVCCAYPKLKTNYQKMFKDVKNVRFVLDFMYTKDWIEYKHKPKNNQTVLWFKKEKIGKFLYFYRRYLR